MFDTLIPATSVHETTATFDVYATEAINLDMCVLFFTVEFNIPHNPSMKPDEYNEEVTDEKSAKKAPKWLILRDVGESFYPKSYRVFLNGEVLFCDSYNDTQESRLNFYDQLDRWDAPNESDPNKREISVSLNKLGELIRDIGTIPKCTDKFTFEVEIGFRPEVIFLPDITYTIKTASIKVVYDQGKGSFPYKMYFMTRSHIIGSTDKDGRFYGNYEAKRMDHFFIRTACDILYDVQYAIIYKTALVGALPSLSFPHGDCSRLTLSFKTAESGPMSVHVYIYELKKAFLHFNSDRD